MPSIAAEDKPQFKATITIAAHQSSDLDEVIDALQGYMVTKGMEVEGTIKREYPLLHRDRVLRIATGTPMDRTWGDER